MVRSNFADAVTSALIDRRVAEGHWEGRLSSSALATATAVTAIAVARDQSGGPGDEDLIRQGVCWLASTQNADGGWGDTPDSLSNISTTALAWAALAFDRQGEAGAAVHRAEAWIARAAGSAAPEALAAALVSRYGKDRTFSVPILTMCAVAGRLGAGGWRLVPQLPFEVAVLPRRWFGAMRLPVVSYALPALIAMGLARHRRRPRPGVAGVLRDAARPRVLSVLATLQPAGGGFLEAVPLTSFVCMSLVAAGEAGHPVVSGALDFLRWSVRDDGSWPIDSNLATWVTTLSVNALAEGGGLSRLGARDRTRIREWLLGQQWRAGHPYTGAAPGGWAWTDLPGGVPDADDTAGALIALSHLRGEEPEVREAAFLGVRWLLDLQNRDGGIPTFCRGWGTLPFDRSAPDVTAHALRAWAAWHEALPPALARRTSRAVQQALGFLSRAQRPDGTFVPLWFGHQAVPREENPVFGTSRVLKGLAACSGGAVDREARAVAARASAWLVAAQNADGGWGGGAGIPSGIEETAAAVSGLAAVRAFPASRPSGLDTAVGRGVEWLEAATLGGRRFPPSPIGLYFARLWYAEDLYPLIFAADALGAARRGR